MFGIQVWDSWLRFRFGNPFEESGLGYGCGILICDSTFGFRFGTKVRDSCLGFQLRDSCLRFSFGIQILDPGL